VFELAGHYTLNQNFEPITDICSCAEVRSEEVGWTVIQLLVDQPADQQQSVYCRLDIYKV